MDSNIKRHLYVEVEDNENGREIINNLIMLLSELKYRKGFVQGWMTDDSTD